jgi:hypothetical protein
LPRLLPRTRKSRELAGKLLAVEVKIFSVGLEEALGVDGVGKRPIVLALEAEEVTLANLGGICDFVEGKASLCASLLQDRSNLAATVRGLEGALLFVHDA